MKRVLITGASGFIGSYLMNNLKDCELVSLSLRNPEWKSMINALEFDAIVHCAGLAHSSGYTEEDYYIINVDLARQLAEICAARSSHFILLSSIIVHGEGDIGLITSNSTYTSLTPYGKSKLLAEQELIKLQIESSFLTILRLPLVYGPSVKGNLKKLLMLSKSLMIVPKFSNKRSMVDIQFLVEILSDSINGLLDKGLYYLCDIQTYSTNSIIRHVRLKQNLNTIEVPLFRLIILFLIRTNKWFSKLYGDAYIDLEMHNVLINKKTNLYNLIDVIYED
jgi:nucleoside-diphosphate-sugar epimerase